MEYNKDNLIFEYIIHYTLYLFLEVLTRILVLKYNKL